MKTERKTISVLIPTLNSASVLEDCLASIARQDYPQECIEIIVADGGSRDRTLEIARRYTDQIFSNSLQTGEAGKAVALKHATGELVAFIDSDNILPTPDWMAQMTAPFADEEIVGAEPLAYTYRRTDGAITRYCALMGMNDPLCLFLGNYDRLCALTGKWTEMPVATAELGNYFVATLDARYLPTIGANGFLVRRNALGNAAAQEYFFDIDVVYALVARGQNTFAKVKTGIVHVFSGDAGMFWRKQQRRINDYLYFNRAGLRLFPWRQTNRQGLIKFTLYCLLILPLIAQSTRGWLRRHDRAWFFHPFACWITLVAYTIGTLRGWLTTGQPHKRSGWRQ